MSIHQKINHSDTLHTGFVINTSRERWVIPSKSELLKMLLQEQNIRVEDLLFSSQGQCHRFIKKLFLLALEDEYKNREPSVLAIFARQLIALKNTNQH